jgi:hypothetical protein
MLPLKTSWAKRNRIVLFKVQPAPRYHLPAPLKVFDLFAEPQHFLFSLQSRFPKFHDLFLRFNGHSELEEFLDLINERDAGHGGKSGRITRFPQGVATTACPGALFRLGGAVAAVAENAPKGGIAFNCLPFR